MARHEDPEGQSSPWEQPVDPLQLGVHVPGGLHEVEDERRDHQGQARDEVDEEHHVLSRRSGFEQKAAKAPRIYGRGGAWRGVTTEGRKCSLRADNVSYSSSACFPVQKRAYTLSESDGEPWHVGVHCKRDKTRCE